MDKTEKPSGGKKPVKKVSPSAAAKEATAKKRAAKAAKKPSAKAGAKKAGAKKAKTLNVIMETNMGPIELELYPDKAPVTVKNFTDYVNSGFFDGLIFHRVISGFMIQGGGFDNSLRHKDGNAPIKIESDNGLKNDRGTIAMARTSDPNSATSQFFINLENNDFLNYREPSLQGYGYAVFGKVVKGMETVDAIGALPTGHGGPFQSDLPLRPVIIETVKIK